MDDKIEKVSEETSKFTEPKVRQDKIWKAVALIAVCAVVFTTVGYYAGQNRQSESVTVQAPSISGDDQFLVNQETANATKGYVATEAGATNGSEQEIIFYRYDLNGKKTELFKTSINSRSKIKGSISEDGKLIAYVDAVGNAKTFNTVTKESKTIRQATNTEEIARNDAGNFKGYTNATISPDGKTIALDVTGWEWTGIALINSDGTNYREISPKGQGLQLAELSWSSNSSDFVISGGRNDLGGSSACIYIGSISDPDNGKQILPGNESAKYEDKYKDVFGAKFSDDGTKIAFGYRYLDTPEVNNGKAESYRGIYIINNDGSGMKQVTDNRSFSTSPLWLNNTSLVYGLSNFYTGDNKGVYRIRLDDSNNGLLYQSDKNGYEPSSISKDKKYLSFEYGNKAKYFDELSEAKILDLSSNKLLDNGKVIGFVGWLY